MDKKILLGLAGEIAAGKGTVAEYLINNKQAAYYKLSTPVRDILKRLHKEVCRENMSNLTSALRKLYGESYLIDVLKEDIKIDKNTWFVLDGIRKPEEVEKLNSIPGFRFIYVRADEKKRYERLIKRGENDGDQTKTYEQFLKDKELESERDIRGLEKIAHYIVENSGNLKELYQKIDEIISKEIL